MSNISIKINLARLKAVRQKQRGKEGVMIDCLILPIAANHLFEGKDGALYLDLTAFELKEKKEGINDTHLVKQQLPTEVFKAMSDEQKKSTPILGNATVWAGDRSPGGGTTAAPEIVPEDDLPF